MLSTDDDDNRGWLWQLRTPPPEAAGRDLLRLLAGNEFQDVLRNYRDLRFLARDLMRWQDNIVAFQDILTLRREGYRQRLPRIDAGYRRLDLAAARERRDAYANRLREIAAGEDATALATTKELRLQARLEKVAALLQKHAAETTLTEQREKLRRLRGLYRWRLAQAYKARLWKVRKHLRSLDDVLAEAARRRHDLAAAREAAPRGFAGYERRIERLQHRLRRLQSRVASAMARHEAYLGTLALRTLAQRDERLRAYETQARFGLARIYDLAAGEEARQP